MNEEQERSLSEPEQVDPSADPRDAGVGSASPSGSESDPNLDFLWDPEGRESWDPEYPR